MSLNELKMHEKGILQIAEDDITAIRRVTKNNKLSTSQIGSLSQNNLGLGADTKLTKDEYNQIFDRDPTFNERKAFVNVFRKQWKDDLGYGSAFNRRKSYKMAKNKSAQSLERKQRTKIILKE